MSSLWTFLAGQVFTLIIAVIAQVAIAYRERGKKIRDTKLDLYMSWLPFLAEVYACAAYPKESFLDERYFLRKKMEILGALQLMGPDQAMDAFVKFCDIAAQGVRGDPSFDLKAMHLSFGALNGYLCCEIHGELPPLSAEVKNDPKPAR